LAPRLLTAALRSCLVRRLGRAGREHEAAVTHAAVAVLGAGGTVRGRAVEAGVARRAIRRAVQAVVLVVDVLADGSRRAQVGLEARAGVAAVVDQRRATHGAGRLRRGARDRAGAAALRTGVVRRVAELATRLVAVGVRVAVALRVRLARAALRVAVVASAAIRVGRAEAALGARAARAVAARSAVGVRAALVARATTAALPGSAAGARAGGAHPFTAVALTLVEAVGAAVRPGVVVVVAVIAEVELAPGEGAESAGGDQQRDGGEQLVHLGVPWRVRRAVSET